MLYGTNRLSVHVGVGTSLPAWNGCCVSSSWWSIAVQPSLPPTTSISKHTVWHLAVHRTYQPVASLLIYHTCIYLSVIWYLTPSRKTVLLAILHSNSIILSLCRYIVYHLNNVNSYCGLTVHGTSLKIKQQCLLLYLNHYV